MIYLYLWGQQIFLARLEYDIFQNGRPLDDNITFWNNNLVIQIVKPDVILEFIFNNTLLPAELILSQGTQSA